MTAAQRLLHALDAALHTASLYLPLLVMSALAMASYWVVSLSPAPDLPKPTATASGLPDYVMTGLRARTFTAQGELRTEVTGSQLRHYPDERTVIIDRAQLRSLHPSGQVTTSQSQQLLSNDERTLWTLRGDVVVTRIGPPTPGNPAPAPFRLEGQTLTYRSDTDTLSSDLPVVLIRGQDRIAGNSLAYQDGAQIADMRGRVRATLQPQRP